MLLEMAIGDAYAIPWEFVDMDQFASVGPLDLSGYHRHPKYADLGGGRYTDDTQRTIANAEVLLGDTPFDPVSYAASYLGVFRRDPRPGYSNRYFRFLKEAENVTDFVTKVRPHGSTNGAVMGSAVCGFLQTPFEVRHAALTQAGVTHASDTFVWAEAVAMMAHFFLYRLGSIGDLPDFLEEFCPIPAQEGLDGGWSSWFSINQPEPWRATMDAMSPAYIAAISLAKHHTLSEMIRDIVSRGGDTDTACAVTMAVASCSDEIENDLPNCLQWGLEDGPYGRTFLIDLEGRLRRKFRLST